MHVVTENVNTAFEYFVKFFQNATTDEVERYESRNGPALRIREPVIITYQEPYERVLFSPGRDCNPFFHLFEAIWMLAGCRDLKPLQYYVSTFDAYSDDGTTLNGAYGYRWRHAKGGYSALGPVDGDQLELLIDHLRDKKDSRRAVLNMWNVEDDLLNIDDSKDVCCNLNVCFQITSNNLLNMTVFNRSNDLIFGALGANAVHFSILQEYMARRIGCGVGVYNQISNDMHIYLNQFTPDKWFPPMDMHQPLPQKYGITVDYTSLVIQDPENFDLGCQQLVDCYDGGVRVDEPWLDNVVRPMMAAFHQHKKRNYAEAKRIMTGVDSP